MTNQDIMRLIIQFVLAGSISIAFLFLVFEKVIGASQILPIFTLVMGYYFRKFTVR